MKNIFLFTLALALVSKANAVEYSIDGAIGTNLMACSSYQKSLENFKMLDQIAKSIKNPERRAKFEEMNKSTLERIVSQSRIEAAIVKISVQTPLIIQLQNLKKTITTDVEVSRAVINAPGATVTESSIEFPYPGTASMQISFTLAGLCEFVGPSDTDVKGPVNRALKTLLQ